MALNIKVSSSDWIDLRTRGYTSGMYLLNAVGAAIEYSTAATPVPGTTLVGSSAVLISGTYLWVRGSGDCELYTASEWSAANVKTEPLLVSTTSSGVVASKGAGVTLSAGSGPLTVPGYDALDPVVPTIPTLTLNVRGTLSTANPAVIWIDPDGTCYGAYTTLLYRSTDGGATWGSNGSIASFAAGGHGKILAFRRLANGEAIISTDASGSVPSKLWLSSGFAADPATATWTAVLTRTDTETAFIDRSISVDGNSIACAAYGYPGYGITRYVYYSTDAGVTWTTPFDTYAQCPNPSRAHIHGCAIDSIGGLLWVYTGDGADNRGVHVATLNDFSRWEKIWADQPTTAYPMRNAMILGTDNPEPNGVVRIRRNSWQLETAASVPSNNVLVGSTVYSRGRTGDALYLASVFLGGQGDHGFVHATADGENVYVLYEAPVGTSIRRCLGPTNTGLLHLVVTRGGTGTEETATAIAPSWVPQSSMRNIEPLDAAYQKDCTVSLPGIWYAGRGSPTSAKAGVNESAYEAMLFDPAASETAICPILVPPGANYVNIDLWWTNAGAGTGFVVWTLHQGRAFVDGATLNTSDFNDPTALPVAAPVQHVLKKTRIRTRVPTLGASVLRLALNRNGTDAADTLDANDAAAVAIVATRAF